jgi:hypothetical protein
MLRKRHFMLLLPLVVVFPFGMDTYVPSIVEITGEFHTSSQLILLTYFLLVAVVWKIWQRRQKNPR